MTIFYISNPTQYLNLIDSESVEAKVEANGLLIVRIYRPPPNTPYLHQ